MEESVEKELIEWFRGRPPEVLALARRFPPMSKVRGLIPMHVPGPGKVATVVSYLERNEDDPDGSVGVVGDSDELGPVKTWCLPETIELVECAMGCTVEMVERAIARSLEES